MNALPTVPAERGRWRVTPVRRSLAGFGPEWDRLNATRFGNHPLLDSRFVEGLLQHFGNGREVVAARYVDDRCDAMCLLEPQGHGAWCSFLPSQAQLGPTLVGEASQLNGLIQALPGHAVQLDLLCCDPRLGRLWAGGCEGAFSCHPHAVTIGIDLGMRLEAWQQSMQRSLRNNLKRYEKRAQADGQALRFVTLSDRAELGSAVRRYAELEGAGWKGQEGTALGSVPEQLRFYEELLDRFAAQGQAHVFELWSGDRLAASRLTIRQAGRIIMLKTTFDESLREWAPGRLLLARVVEHAFSNWPGGSLEFYTNATADQLSWGVQQRRIVHVCIRRGAAWDAALRARAAVRAARAGSKPEAEQAPLLEESVETMNLAETLDQDTERLFAAHEARHFQLGLDWWRLLDRVAMGATKGSRMLLLRRGGHPVAALPVNVEPGLEPMGGMVGALMNFYSTTYLPVAGDDVTGLDLLPLVTRLRELCNGAPTLQFESMDPEAPQTAALESALRAAGYAVERYSCLGNWYLPVTQSWEEYLEARPGELRSTIRRMGKRLQELGGRIEILSSVDEVDRALSAFHAVYTRSWKHSEPLPGIVDGLVSLCARRSWLRMGLIWLDDKPIAAQIWVVNGGRAMIYKLAYDQAHKRLAPGTVLTATLMRHAFVNDRVVEVDYLVGDEPYKKQWMTHRRDRCGLVANDLDSPIGWLGAARQFASRMRHRLPSVLKAGSVETK